MIEPVIKKFAKDLVHFINTNIPPSEIKDTKAEVYDAFIEKWLKEKNISDFKPQECDQYTDLDTGKIYLFQGGKWVEKYPENVERMNALP